jgi:MAC/Perforin domain.
MLPAFTDPFLIALGNLHDASSKTSTDQLAAFKRFVTDFGTHYMTNVELGATFSQVSSYSENVRSQMDAQAMEDCNTDSGSKVFGIQVNPGTSQCTAEDQSVLNSFSSSDVTVRTVTRGSDPTTIDEWATQEFTPVPLKYMFSPVPNIFLPQFIDNKGLTNLAGEVINSTQIRQWFVPLYYNYCETMDINCVEPHGCGFDDKCPLDAICIGEPTVPHECEGNKET